MQHLRGQVAVDTSKFESWPLLRPDELTSLPTEVLRASVADLDTMCRHASGKEKGEAAEALSGAVQQSNQSSVFSRWSSPRARSL